MTEAMTAEQSRALTRLLMLIPSDMYCEEHPTQFWPHDDCAGPGVPIGVQALAQEAAAKREKPVQETREEQGDTAPETNPTPPGTGHEAMTAEQALREAWLRVGSMITIEVRTACPTCGGVGFYEGAGYNEGDRFTCTTCKGTGTVVVAERSKDLRTVAEWVAGEVHFEDSDGECWCCGAAIGATPSAHAPGCIHELAKKVLEVA